MNEENLQILKKIFKEAAEIVKDLPEPLQPVAFEMFAKLLLRETERKSSVGKKADIEFLFPGERKEGKEKIDILAQELQISDLKLLQTIYEVSTKGEVKVIAQIRGDNAEIQRKIAYLYLLAKLICEREDWVSAIELSKHMKRYGVDDGHVATNLGRERGKILCSGRKKGKKYGLTPIGIQEAKKILKELLSG